MRSPSPLHRLVLVAPALRLGPAGEAPTCTPLPAWASLLLGRRDVRSMLISGTASYPAFTDELLGRFVHRQEAITPERVAAYQAADASLLLQRRHRRLGVRVRRRGLRASASLDPAKITAWAQKGPPVVLIWGTADTITPIVQARSLLRWMPEAKLMELPDVGHIPHIEDPTKLAAALLGGGRPCRAGVPACQSAPAKGTPRKVRRP